MSFRERFIKYAGSKGQIQLDFLDSLDFLPYLENHMTLKDLRDEIEDLYDYGFKRDLLPKELKGCAFNLMDDSELAEYLEDRYPNIRVRERVETWYEIIIR